MIKPNDVKAALRKAQDTPGTQVAVPNGNGYEVLAEKTYPRPARPGFAWYWVYTLCAPVSGAIEGQMSGLNSAANTFSRIINKPLPPNVVNYNAKTGDRINFPGELRGFDNPTLEVVDTYPSVIRVRLPDGTTEQVVYYVFLSNRATFVTPEEAK